MTNYKWIVENMEELVKGLLTDFIGKKEGKPSRCSEICCNDCDFKESLGKSSTCEISTREWLEAEHESLYKKGDIVLAYESDILVVKDINDHTVLLVSRLKEPRTTYNANIKDIIKKVGNIYDEE